VTREYDVPLSPIRGYISDSFAFELGNNWRDIEKDIYVYYVGDYDPSGFDLERNAQEKLTEFAGKHINWVRLGLNESDFDEFSLVELPVKKADSRSKEFVRKHGDRCAEIDALPPPALRDRIRTAIEKHVPREQWEKLRQVEAAEKATFRKLFVGLEEAS